MSPMLLALAVFLGVTALVGGLAVWLHDKSGNRVEDRLDMLTGSGASASAKDSLFKQGGLLAQALQENSNLFQKFLERISKIDINLYFEQADVSMSVSQLGLICGGLAATAAVGGYLLNIPLVLVPVAAAALGAMPLVWVLMRRRRRLRTFGMQFPDGLDMLARALRSGQSLSVAIGMMSNEMPAPLGREFGRVFEEQNLGVPLEDAIKGMAARIPNLDLKFFATAVVLQRQTGGDLAEILDKIGYLVRERFKIWGQIQALTGEGRLSGVVLLGLPILLFAAVYRLNPDYLMVLLTDPMGKKMLFGAIVLQVIGALVIRKIVNIKV